MTYEFERELDVDKEKAKLALEARMFLKTLRMSSIYEIANDPNLDEEQIMTTKIKKMLDEAKEMNDFDNIKIFEQSLKILPSFYIGE